MVSVPYVDEEDLDEYDVSEEIVVPYKENNGVKTIRVTLNGMGVDMIFDTGCSSTLISVAEAEYLYSKGLLTDDDIIGMSASQIADGSIVPNMVIILREIVIGDVIHCSDVQATVSLNEDAPLLLGNEVLDRVASFTIDNQDNVIRFKMR